MAIGQGFTYIVENLTDDDIDVYFDIVAKTVCGNEVSDKAFNSLKPREKSGGGNEVGGDAMISYVKKQDCEGNKISYIDNGNTITGTNRINDVYIKNLVVKHRPKKLVESKRPNEKTKKQLADEEKLNQAMMKQLEKDFDIAHNAKKEEPSNEPETYEKQPVTEAGNINKMNVAQNKIEENKKFIVGKLNNYTYRGQGNAMNGGKFSYKNKITNCYWKSNEFHFTMNGEGYPSYFGNMNGSRNLTFTPETNLKINGNFLGEEIESDNKFFLEEIKNAFDYIFKNNK